MLMQPSPSGETLNSVVPNCTYSMISSVPRSQLPPMARGICSNAVRHKSLGKLVRNQVRGLPTGAVLRHDDARIEFSQSLNRRRDDRLEDRAGAGKSADDRGNLIHAGKFPRALERMGA